MIPNKIPDKSCNNLTNKEQYPSMQSPICNIYICKIFFESQSYGKKDIF